jgi:hypothetical protein
MYPTQLAESQRGMIMRTSVLAVGLIALITGSTWSGTASLAMQVTSLGYRANVGGGGALTTEWTAGNLGNTWAEGEWVPYQLVFQGISPGLAELDSIVVSFDFTHYGTGQAIRFLDLVRGLQVGTVPRGDSEGWAAPGGGAFPVTTRAEVEFAQNYPDEEVWAGFAFLNLPNEQINRTVSGGLDVPDGAERHIFKIYRQDLLDAGIDINETTVVIYYQLHESKTFVWQNQLQDDYDAPPTDAWGGYLYGTDGWPTAPPVSGSGYIPGSSGHVDVENPAGGTSVPIPIPDSVSGIAESTHAATGAEILLLVGPRPNPAQKPITFSLEMNQASIVSVFITDVTGGIVHNVPGGHLSAGRHLFSWDLKRDNGIGCAPGIYFLNLRAGNQVVTRKVVLLR